MPQSLTGTQAQANPVWTARVPPEGPKAILRVIPFVSAPASDGYALDTVFIVNQAQISGLQAVYIDNYDNADTLTITVQDTGYRICAPPQSQGTYALLCSNNTRLVITSPSATSDVAIQLLNFPAVPDWWGLTTGGSVVLTGTVDIGNSPTVEIGGQPIGVTGTFTPSGTQTVTGTVTVQGTVTATSAAETAIAASATVVATGGTAVTVFPANTVTNAVIANPSTATELLFVAVGINAGTVEVGGTFGIPPGGSFTFGHVAGSITANAMTNGHTFSAVGNIL